ncbi:MAG TPA: adenine phosphoribosyltransferase [Thermoanaerobaculia bacterium]|nr:adenine phosphoribosyltransferase [Thermoanaerobaculia bacterium]
MTDLRAFIRDVPDFPTAGILFRDITPLLASGEAFSQAVHQMAAPFRGDAPSKILGIEARGFMFGAAMARELGVGFVPARKSGKLPRESVRVAYGLEYGRDSLEVHADAFSPGERVVIADDVLATGGTARAAAELAERLGASVLGLSFLIELSKLDGARQLPGRRIHSVLMLE